MTRRLDPADLPKIPDLFFENHLWARGYSLIAGLDEAGRGAWAGPVSAGAVILPPLPNLPDLLARVRDSKQMVHNQRMLWAEEIRKVALAWGVGFATHAEIDALGIVPATRLAMQRALEQTRLQPDHLLVDALRLPDLPIPQTSLVKGDARSLSIAAASILAKTARDLVMMEMDANFPDYGFARHKGYGTASHCEALRQHGPCSIHRFSFEPIHAALEADCTRNVPDPENIE